MQIVAVEAQMSQRGRVRMSRLQQTLQELYRARDTLERRLTALIQAIEKAEQLQRELDALGPDAAEAVDAEVIRREQERETQKKRQRNTLPPIRIAEAARSALLEAGKPLKRGDIVRLLEERGITLAGKDRNKNLGTILWRHPEMFIVIGDLGYWPKDTALPGVYTPE